jgi:hypothetical protein
MILLAAVPCADSRRSFRGCSIFDIATKIRDPEFWILEPGFISIGRKLKCEIGPKIERRDAELCSQAILHISTLSKRRDMIFRISRFNSYLMPRV